MRRRRACLLAAAGLAFAVTAFSCSSPPGAPVGLPLAPSPPGAGAGTTDLRVECQSPVFVGELSVCAAVHRRLGVPSNVSFTAAWSSSLPDVFAFGAMPGTVIGRAAGTATITARYEGLQASAPVTAELVDGLKVKAAADQGEFRVGTQVLMSLQGNYSVASASRASLSLLISNQDGRAVAVGDQRFVTGGDHFVLTIRFTVPPDTTRLCRAAVLIIGELRLSEPPPGPSIISCLPVVPS